MESLETVLAFARARSLGRRLSDMTHAPRQGAMQLESLWQQLDLDGLPLALAACALDGATRYGTRRVTRWLARCLRSEALFAGRCGPVTPDGRLGQLNRTLLAKTLRHPGAAERLVYGLLNRRSDHARRLGNSQQAMAQEDLRRVEVLRRLLATGNFGRSPSCHQPVSAGGITSQAAGGVHA